jgi:NAD(P) transhydrogenase
MGDLGFRVQHVIKTEIDVTQAQLSRNGVEVLYGRPALWIPHHIAWRIPAGSPTTKLHVIIATGTKPAVSPKVPFNGRTIINSDQILQMPEIPKTLIVVGGGVIGVEYTCMFATLGVRVILVEKRPRLLEFADSEMVEALSYHLRDSRVTMRLNEEVESVERRRKRRGRQSAEQEEDLGRCAAVCRRPRQGNVDELNLAAAGIEADARGRIPVDADYRTKQPNISRWAT